MTFWDFNFKMATLLNTQLLMLPPWITLPLAYTSEFLSFLAQRTLPGQFFQFTPATLQLPRTEFYFNCAKAHKELGYESIYSIEEGMSQTAKFCSLFTKQQKHIE
jgi:hypothetical protein